MPDDVERLFQQLVQVLADRDPKRLSTPFQISELYQDIVPYRTFRQALRFDTNQDYEMAMLRLLAGEHGFALVTPNEVQRAMLDECRAVNPDTDAFRDYAAARVTLNAEAVRQVLDPQGSYRPRPSAPATPPAPATPAPPAPERVVPQPAVEPPPPARASAPVVTPPPPPVAPSGTAQVVGKGGTVFEVQSGKPAEKNVRASTANCSHCLAELPDRRVLVYCPHCGGQVSLEECARCGSKLETGWRHCVVCGHRVASGPA